MLCSMMLGMTARWMLGRMLPEWPAVLSCVRFRPRLGCHLDVGDSRRGCLPPLRCSHKGNLSRRALSQSVTTASVRSLKCFGRCWEPHHRHTFEVGVRGQAVEPRAQELARSQCPRKCAAETGRCPDLSGPKSGVVAELRVGDKV